jgi:hypothetical protein
MNSKVMALSCNLQEVDGSDDIILFGEKCSDNRELLRADTDHIKLFPLGFQLRLHLYHELPVSTLFKGDSVQEDDLIEIADDEGMQVEIVLKAHDFL